MIPMQHREKKPLVEWKKYQNERASPEQITAWVETYPNMGLGIITGSISGIAVVDIEKGGSTKEYPPTASVKTGNEGWHLFYSLPKEGVVVKSHVRIRELTDTRGQGGYVVAPPSIHPSGVAYEWVETFDSVEELPPFPTHLFAEGNPKKEEVDWMNMALSGIKEGSRNQSMASYIGGLLRTLPEELWGTAGWGGAQATNETFEPPLDIKELRAVFESIAQTELRRRSATQTTSLAVEEGPDFEPTTLSALYEKTFPEQRWVVEGLISVDSITVLSGDSNSLKTFLIQSMAGDIVHGKPFLGHFPTTQGKVLIVDEENNAGDTQRRFNVLGIPASDQLLLVSRRSFRADNEKHVAALKKIIDREEPVLIVFDSLIDIHGANENDAPEMNAVFHALRKLLTEKSAIVVLHHRRKQQLGNGSRAGQSMRGSTGILAAVDAHLAIERRNRDQLTLAQDKTRSQRQMDAFKVAFLPTEDGQHEVFSYLGEDTTKAEAFMELQDQILEVLAAAASETPASPITKDMLSDATHTTPSRIALAITELMSTGQVRKENGPRGKHLYYFVETDESPNDSPVLEEATESRPD